MIIRNRYKVAVSKWRQWTRSGRMTFNYVYGLMYGDQSLFIHPKAVVQKPAYWKTTCWNAAWMAADAASAKL